MATLTLLPQSEKLAPENPWGLRLHPLYHQWRTYQALANYDLVVNAYNTGTGKTRAALLQLLRLQGQGVNVLFIAPTNALLHQHADDIRAFVAEQQLDYHVLEVHAARLRQIAEGQRPGEALQRLIQNPLTYAAEQGLPLDDHRKLPVVLVVNPDIFYYALYFCYGSHDQRNIFEKFLTAFDYVVIDEFHYYDSKQLANFLFFFIISQEFGYFADGRRICLLSATPNPFVITYLNRVFGKRWTLLSPETEPPESAEYPTLPTLTALELELVSGEFQAWVAEHRHELVKWLDEGQDGALISSALWRVNTAYSTLRGVAGDMRLGRITGPEPQEKRQQATAVPLILATPTVDIGYNFVKQHKTRQNLDFVVCDARFGDELVQRLGRAGRVLGKAETDGTAHAVALLPEDAYVALAAQDGATLSRADFAALVNDCDDLPPKQTLYAYIRTHAITECFYPIYQMRRMMPDEKLQARVDALYERVRDIFAPSSHKQAWSLRLHFSKYWHRKQWLRYTGEQPPPLNLETAKHVVDWIKWQSEGEESYEPRDLLPMLEPLLIQQGGHTQLQSFVAGQVHLTEALFNFRDAFEGPTAVIYDPQNLFSSERVNTADLLHIVSNYDVRWLENRREFEDLCDAGEPSWQAGPHALYGILEGWREPRLSIELHYDSPWLRDNFDRYVCRQPHALRGLYLTAREHGGDRYPVESRIAAALESQYITALGIRPKDSRVVYGKLRGSPIYSRRLSVSFPNGEYNEKYNIFLGTQAFQAHAELLGYFFMQDHLNTEAIIL